MSDNGLVNVTINGATVQAEKGRLLIDIAEEMGIFVPRFCYHPGMKSVAVCRMCLVQIEGQHKLMPACATPVDDGMNVNTVAPEAVDAQEGMLEFLLINHPLDCPICDRGGECPLQDQTYRHGPGSSRYVEPKRTYEKALEISDLVVLDRERCVLCWRCVRFCDEVSGDRFIQLVDRGAGTQILTFSDEPFDSYFSGNTIQICPVGALTAKPYRFVSRPWDLETAPSVCGYCAVGCPITNESRDDKLVRCQALPNEQVNEFWNCDKGRFGFHYVSSQERLKTPLLRNERDEFEPVAWGRAAQVIAEKVRGANAVGVVAGGHLTTEDAFAIARLAKKVIGTPHVDGRLQDAGAPYELALEVAGVAGSTATFNDLDGSGTIVWAGPDPKETLPVLYLRIRRAVIEHGAKLVVVGPRRISLDSFATKVVRTVAGADGAAISSLLRSSDRFADEYLEDPLVVCWGPAHPGRDESAAARAAFALAREREAKLLVCPPHAGSQGLVDMGVHPTLDAGYAPAAKRGWDTRAILEAAADGRLDALLLFGADPIADFPEGDLARRALENVGFTAVLELFPTDSVSHADVVLPSAAYAEREGTFTNLERRLQKLEQLEPPPGAAREPWRACAEIARALGTDWGWRSFEDLWGDLKKEVPTHADVDLAALASEAPEDQPYLQSALGGQAAGSRVSVGGPGGQYPKGFRQGAPFQTGQNWPLSWELRAFEAKQRPGYIPPAPEAASGADGETTPTASPAAAPAEPGTFELYAFRLIYDEGTMVSKSAALRNLQRAPFVELNDEDAKALDVADGDEVLVVAGDDEVRLPAVVSGDVAKGAAFVPFDQEGLRANRLIKGTRPLVQVRRA